MAKNIECTITVSEINGKLSIMASIPDGAEKTLAGSLTKALIDVSAGIMNEILGENQTVQAVASH